MALSPTKPVTNGAVRRRLRSWIDSFVAYTVDLESPEICRRWAAIGTIAAVLQQKVSVVVGKGTIWPNLYVWLISEPGVGKSNAIKEARKLIEGLDKMFIAPTNVTVASLTDFMADAKTDIPTWNGPVIECNSALLLPDELSAFMHTYVPDMIGFLTTLYDTDVPYGENKRVSGIRHKFKRPQLNMMVGTTPSNLMHYLPDYAWDQGFTSRIILVQAAKRTDNRDPFAVTTKEKASDLEHDIRSINTIVGSFSMDDPFKQRVRDWRSSGYPPIPTHPRLTHYATRRFAHLFKLCMVSCVDRGDKLVLAEVDFERASKWLFEAEADMPSIFEQGVTHSDTQVQNELVHFIQSQKGEFTEAQLVRKARLLMPAHAVLKTIELMEKSGVLRQNGYNPKLGQRTFYAIKSV